MSDLSLTPRQAAQIAQRVYNVKDDSISKAQEVPGGLGLKGNYAVNNSSRFTATSGIQSLGLSQDTGFGYVAEGEGQFQGHVLIAVRGTNSKFDILTDINAGVALSGNKHIGFKAVFDSYSDKIDGYFKKANKNPSQVHVVGHSLGGALATLTADYLNSRYKTPVKLYTFGCPRVGTKSFAAEVTQKIGEHNFYRVHHENDPVTLIPIWPFYHAPRRQEGDRNPGYSLSGGSFIYHSYHFMDSYVGSIKFQNWNAIASKALAEATKPIDLAKWLNLASQSNYSIGVFSTVAFKMIGKCLTWLIRESEKAVFGALSLIGFTVSSTIDMVALLLHKAAMVSANVADKLKKLMIVIFKFLGKSGQYTGDITTAFLRWVLNLLTSAIGAMYKRAIYSPQVIQVASNKTDDDIPFKPTSGIG